jgi:hypothetical protein
MNFLQMQIPDSKEKPLGSALEIYKQKRARGDEGAFKTHHRNNLGVGVIIILAGDR